MHRSERGAWAACASATRRGPPEGAHLPRAAQRAAAQTFHAVDSSVALVLDAPMRATGADAAVHAPPATDPTSGPTPGGGGGDEEAPHDRSSGARSRQGLSNSCTPCARCGLAAGGLASGQAMRGVPVLQHCLPVWSTPRRLKTVISAHASVM